MADFLLAAAAFVLTLPSVFGGVGEPVTRSTGASPAIQHQAPVIAALRAVFLTRTREEWVAWFADKDVCFAPVLDLHDIGDTPFVAGGVEVLPLPVMHMHMPVLGFRIGGLAYITDAKTIGPETMERIQGVDVLVLNALRDSNPTFAVSEMIRSVRAARRIFALYGAEAKLDYQAFDTPHGYWPDMHRAMWRCSAKHSTSSSPAMCCS
jgi:hypothetical protein